MGASVSLRSLRLNAMTLARLCHPSSVAMAVDALLGIKVVDDCGEERARRGGAPRHCRVPTPSRKTQVVADDWSITQGADTPSW